MITRYRIRMASVVATVVGLLFMGGSVRAQDGPRGGAGPMSLKLPESRSFHMGFAGTLGGSQEVRERVARILAEHADMVVLHVVELNDGNIP